MSTSPHDRIVGPHAVARALRRGPPLPTSVVQLLGHLEVELAFRELVRRLLPLEAETILHLDPAKRNREAERTWAFCSAFEQRYFPIYEVEELEYLVACIPFQRMGWSYDTFHEVDKRPGTLMLRALCAEPYEGSLGARVPLLEAVENLGVPRELLKTVPTDGLSPTDLHAVFDGAPHAAAAEFADWTWGQTDTAFLDFDDDVEVSGADWSDDTIQELTRQWHEAEAMIARVGALEIWLEQDPAKHFALLLEAALTRSHSAAVYPSRSAHAQEASDLQPADRADSEPILALSAGAAA